MDVEVTGENVMFSIDGVIDAEEKHSCVTQKLTYRILVGQTSQSGTRQP